MSDSQNHMDEALQELIDGRLEPAERQVVEEHLSGCPRCQRLRVSLEQARQAVRAAAADGAEAPPELRASILAALDAEDRSRTAVPSIGLRRRRAALA